jgi:hypothetical protein
MNDLQKALGDISSIRRQMACSTEFRGYGPATLAVTGLLAMAGAAVQAAFVKNPSVHLERYLALWIGTAILCAALSGRQMYTRARRMHSALSDEMIRMAVVQFLPSVAAGALLTLVITHYSATSAWLLPGLWQVLFSLGIFASCRFLPRPLVAAGAWYLFTGLFCISLGDARAFSPWAMGVPFAGGQFLVSAVLFFHRTESPDEQ